MVRALAKPSSPPTANNSPTGTCACTTTLTPLSHAQSTRSMKRLASSLDVIWGQSVIIIRVGKSSTNC